MKKRTRLVRRRPTKTQPEIDRIGRLEQRILALEERVRWLENPITIVGSYQPAPEQPWTVRFDTMAGNVSLGDTHAAATAGSKA